MFKKKEHTTKHHISDFDLGWLLGFTEGEGCFFIKITKDKKYRTGYSFSPTFFISLSIKDKGALMNIKEMLGKCNIPSSVHEISMSKDRSCYLNCFLELGSGAAFKLRNLLKDCDFKSKKKQDFLFWSEAIDRMKRGEHLSYEGLLKIVEIKDKMNISGHKPPKKYTHDYFVSKKDEIMARDDIRRKINELMEEKKHFQNICNVSAENEGCEEALDCDVLIRKLKEGLWGKAQYLKVMKSTRMVKGRRV